MRLFCCIIILQGSQGISAPYTQTLHARSSVLYLCDWKIRKKSEPISNSENWVRIILIWCGKQGWILTAHRRSQATLWPDSLRLLQVPCTSILRKQNKKAFDSLESFCWCGRWDWILTARRRSVSAALRPHCGLIHYGFFKSCFCLDISLE